MECAGDGGVLDPGSRGDGQHQQDDADEGDLEHLARAQVTQVEAHEKRDRNRQTDAPHSPGRGGQGVDDDHGQDGHDDEHDRQGGDEGGDATEASQFVLGHLTEGSSAPSHGDDEDEVVLHSPSKDDAHDDPDRARQVAHLSRQHRPDERAGARDGGEVMAVEDAAIRGHEIPAVVVILGRGGPVVVGMDEFVLDVRGVEPVADEVRADGGEDEPDAVDGFTPSHG